MREKWGCVHVLEIICNSVFICIYFSLDFKWENRSKCIHSFASIYIFIFWSIQDPTLISNVSGYEPYQRIKAVRGSIMWPENYNIPHDSSDNGAVLGYVCKTEE